MLLNPVSLLIAGASKSSCCCELIMQWSVLSKKTVPSTHPSLKQTNKYKQIAIQEDLELCVTEHNAMHLLPFRQTRRPPTYSLIRTTQPWKQSWRSVTCLKWLARSLMQQGASCSREPHAAGSLMQQGASCSREPHAAGSLSPARTPCRAAAEAVVLPVAVLH
jgi:hypothetical protein